MDLLKQFGPLLSQVAPTIATALGGPLAGIAVKTLSNSLLGHENGTEEDVATAMQSATPEQLGAIKKIDADFKVRMKELDIDLERISAGDRESARKMQTQSNDWIPRVLALLITVGFFGILVWMLVNGMPTSGTEALLMMLGALGTAWTGVINFYYGSSAGSKAKTEAIAIMKGEK
jgi:membrane-bound ClpP family serine protease